MLFRSDRLDLVGRAEHPERPQHGAAQPGVGAFQRLGQRRNCLLLTTDRQGVRGGKGGLPAVREQRFERLARSAARDPCERLPGLVAETAVANEVPDGADALVPCHQTQVAQDHALLGHRKLDPEQFDQRGRDGCALALRPRRRGAAGDALEREVCGPTHGRVAAGEERSDRRNRLAPAVGKGLPCRATRIAVVAPEAIDELGRGLTERGRCEQGSGEEHQEVDRSSHGGLLSEMPGGAVGAREPAVGFLVVDEALGRAVPGELAPDPEGDVAEVGGAGRAVADLDIGGR